MLQYLGLIASIILSLAVLLVVYSARGHDLRTISKHVASSKFLTIMFGGSMLVASVIFSIWVYAWYIPSLELGVTFGILYGISIVGLLLTVLIPDVPGPKSFWHHMFAYTMSILFLPIGSLAIDSDVASGIAQTFGLALLMYMTISFAYSIAKELDNKTFLRLQALYFASFILLILAIAYL